MTTGSGSPAPHEARLVRALFLFGCYAVAVAIATSLAALNRDAAFIGGEFVPVTNDSFYHARRILDTVFGTPGFYQFEERLHVPDGAWIPWPWAYDYLLAQLTRLLALLLPAVAPETILAFVPVAWLAVNGALFLAAGTALGLRAGYVATLLLAFSLSPLIQLPHGPGMLDHHYVELTFVLLYVWLGLRWHSRRDSAWRAAALGVALGAAPAFHNGLFILQVPLLLATFLLWLRGDSVPLRAALYFAGALIVSTALMLLPSEPFRRLMFEFALHSWFHLYIACCTAAVVAFFAARTPGRSSLLQLAALGVVLTLPLSPQLARGFSFLGTDFSVLDQIGEAISPIEMFFRTMGPAETVSYYSWLLVLAPVLLAAFVWRALRARTPESVFFSVIAAMGLALMLTQYRFHYFGLFAMYAGLLLFVQELAMRYRWRPSLVALGIVITVAVAFQPPLKERLFTIYALGADPHYEQVRPLLVKLGEHCKEDPGVVLADHDDGNYILYHTDCSIVANNFIMRDEDETNIRSVYEIMSGTLDDVRNSPLNFKYVLVRAADFILEEDGKPVLIATESSVSRLLVDDGGVPGFRPLLTVKQDKTLDVMARLLKVEDAAVPEGGR